MTDPRSYRCGPALIALLNAGGRSRACHLPAPISSGKTLSFALRLGLVTKTRVSRAGISRTDSISDYLWELTPSGEAVADAAEAARRRLRGLDVPPPE